MNHRFYTGEIFHKRFEPKTHQFVYDYFFLDIDVNDWESLSNSLMKVNGLGIMGFLARDHFGEGEDFKKNARYVAASLGWDHKGSIRFLTLPRIFNFVFNPISLLIKLGSDSRPTHLVAEVHNYNGGRVLYPVVLEAKEDGTFSGVASKTMYVSPFMNYEGEYRFQIQYTDQTLSLSVTLTRNAKKILIACFNGTVVEYSSLHIRKILWNHTFLTLFVVTRTLFQTLKLKLKGLEWYSPRPQDQIKKELA